MSRSEMASVGLEERGTPLTAALAAVVMIHGRGSSPAGILALTSHLSFPNMAFVAPTAAGGSWYPQRFLAPRATNEPALSAALNTVERVLAQVEAVGIPVEKTVLLGFSQGACLVLEYAARHPQRYGGVVGLSGGLIGSDDELIGYDGSLNGTPVFLGCSDVDEHIPLVRVEQAAATFDQLGAVVTKHIYPNFGHTINMDEVEQIRALLSLL